MFPLEQHKVEQHRENLEMGNSILWFAMDALWMLNQTWLSALIGVPTLLSGLALTLLARKKEVLAIDLAVFLWIVMNYCWLMSEYLESPILLTLSKVGFCFGVLSLFAAIRLGNSWRSALASFRRFRFRPIVKDLNK